YAPLVAARVGRVVLETVEPLASIMRTVEGIDDVVIAGEPLPPFDLHVPMMSLPRAFRTTPQTIPAATPYLRADPAAKARWAAVLDAYRGRFKIGLVWSGRMTSTEHRGRSIPLAMLVPLFHLDNVTVVSLQKDAPAEDRLGLPLLDWTDQLHTFGDTGALIE